MGVGGDSRFITKNLYFGLGGGGWLDLILNNRKKQLDDNIHNKLFPQEFFEPLQNFDHCQDK